MLLRMVYGGSEEREQEQACCWEYHCTLRRDPFDKTLPA